VEMCGAFAECQTEHHPILYDSDGGHCEKANGKESVRQDSSLMTEGA